MKIPEDFSILTVLSICFGASIFGAGVLTGKEAERVRRDLEEKKRER